MRDPQKTIQTLNKQYFDAINTHISKIYVDMEMLQDFRLGALLSTLTVKEEMAYILSQLEQYNNRFDLNTAKHFPVLHKTDEELDEIIKKESLKIAFISPWTRIYDNFHAVLAFLGINNKHVNDKKELLQVVINCADMEYPIQLFDRLVRSLQQFHGKISFKLSHYPRYQGPLDFYLQFDMFFMYDHEAFLNREEMLDKFTTKDCFMSKIIYTLPLINESLKIDESERVKALASTHSILNLYCDFFYMHGGIDLVRKKESPEEETLNNEERQESES